MTKGSIGEVMSLYRQVLRLHRDKVPEGVMRELGNGFAASEFRSHLKNPKTTREQWGEFFEQWNNYVELLRGQTSSDGSVAPPEMEPAELSKDQRQRMEQLKMEAMNLSTDLLGQPKNQ